MTSMPLHIEVLVEEPSAESALRNLLPRMLPAGATFSIYPSNGKSDLLRKLPDRLKGYRKWMPPGWKIVVLIDEDRQDCGEMKRQLEAAAQQAGLLTKSGNASGFQVLNRIAIEELEAWFFGDVTALAAAYPGVPSSLSSREAYRTPDAIKGGTWGRLEKVLQKAGYFSTGLRKLEAAAEISRHMDPAVNRSKSFQVFLSGLRAMCPS